MSKLYSDIYRMSNMINTIEQYNNFNQLGAKEDIIYLRDKIKNLYNIKNTDELVKEFTFCAKMVNIYHDDIDSEFKKYVLEEIKKENEE